MSEQSEEMVYVVANGGQSGRSNIHTNPDCHYVLRANTVFEKPRSVIDDDRLCAACSGEYNPGENSPADTTAMRKALSSMAPEDAGLSALGERPGQDGGSA